MEKYSPLIIEYIQSKQKEKLMGKYGIGFEEKLSEIFPSNDSFLDFIEKDLEKEFGDSYDDPRFEIEALLKNDATDEIPNLTKYELRSHRRILSMAESTFKFAIKNEFEEYIPYNATLYSDNVEAEIISYEALDRPIIFFHGGLFIANLLFCKLYVQLISEKINEGEVSKKSEITLLSIYFFNCYFSKISKIVPEYSLKSNFEKSILAILLESISLFIFSHEVGHASYRHFENEDEKTTQELWDDEYEADLYATNIIINLYRKKEDRSIFTLIAPILFFKYLILLEKYRPEINEIKTHPPSIKRLEYYYIHLQNLTNEAEEEEIKEFLTLENEISLELISTFEKAAAFNKK